MTATLNGRPLSSSEGLRAISRMKEPTLSPSVWVKSAIRRVPMVSVVRHVNANKAMFNQGNLCCGASSNRISAGGLNVLFMKRLKLLSEHSERLQVFAWLKAHGFSRGYVHFRAGTRVPSDASLPRLDREDAEAPQLNLIIGTSVVAFWDRWSKTRDYNCYFFCKHIFNTRRGVRQCQLKQTGG